MNTATALIPRTFIWVTCVGLLPGTFPINAVAQAPIINAQPRNQTVPQNATVSFSVGAAGAPPISYQWKKLNCHLKDAGRINGATGATLTISSAQPSDIGVYRVVVSNDDGSVDSDAALLLIGQGSIAAWGANDYGQTLVPFYSSNVIAVSGGFYHSLALRGDGTVFGWGAGSANTVFPEYGQSIVPAGLSNVVGIAAGGYHSIAVKADGTAVAWGNDSFGQATIPAGLSNVVAVEAGAYHSVALKRDGTVFVWGYNWQQSSPPPDLSNVVDISTFAYDNLALKSDGTVIAWGSNTSGQTNVPAGATNVVAIAAGGDAAYSGHNLALKSDGSLLVWGDNTYGQTNVPASATNVVGISAGRFHCLALREDARVVAWGHNDSGETSVPTSFTNILGVSGGFQHNLAILGHHSPVVFAMSPSTVASFGTTVNFKVAVAGIAPLALQWQKNGTNIPGATNLSIALTNIGSSARGAYRVVLSNSLGQIQSGEAQLTSVPVAILFGTFPLLEALTNAVGVAGGWRHNVAVRSDGKVVAWGDNSFGQTNVPLSLTNAVAVDAGLDYSIALRGNGTVIGWGRMAAPAGVSNIITIAAGPSHCLALRKDGTVIAWGLNNFVPVGLSNVVAIAAGRDHNLALRANGTVIAWGSGTQINVPAGLSNVVAIAAGPSQSLALKAEGTIIGWGSSGGYCALCIPDGLSNVVSMETAFYSGNLAVKSDGTVVAWGSGTGQSSLTNVKGVSMGDRHAIVLIGEGEPSITVQPYSRVIATGEAMTLVVLASGAPPINYQWLLNGMNIVGATNSLLTLTNSSVAFAGDYQCVVRNASGITTSTVATVSIIREPLRISTFMPELGFSNGSFRLRITGLAGAGPIILHASTNLLDWASIFTNAPLVGALEYLDNDVTKHSPRFYRASEGP